MMFYDWRECDECTWPRKTFLVHLYSHLAIKLDPEVS